MLVLQGKNQTVRTLCLDANRIADHGVTLLAHALAQHLVFNHLTLKVRQATLGICPGPPPENGGDPPMGGEGAGDQSSAKNKGLAHTGICVLSMW